MKENELRIGNFVHYQINDEFDERKQWNEIIKISYIDFETLDQYYSPIEITESWLLEFGFEKDGPGWYWLNEVNRITKIGFAYEINNQIFEFEELQISIKYVHELQNLYFALTGKEFEMKL